MISLPHDIDSVRLQDLLIRMRPIAIDGLMYSRNKESILRFDRKCYQYLLRIDRS